MPDQSLFRWGILAPGSIAQRFAAGLTYSENAHLAGVGSRSMERAERFASEFGAVRAYGSYNELASDPEIDAVYIASPHSEHAPLARLCLERGKPILVEKPFALNAAQSREIAELAQAKGLFCMEAMWTRFFPAMARLRELVAGGAIGPVRMVMADFGFRTDFQPEARLFNPALGGGALLDVGIYPISFATMLLGKPAKALAVAQNVPTGVDGVTGMLLQFSEGEVAVLSCATQVQTPQQAIVLGETGSIHVHSEWWKPAGLTIRRPSATDEVIELPYPGTGFQFEADEVQRCVRAGLKESPVMPLSETVALAEVIDDLRSQFGLVYPADPSGDKKGAR